MVFQSDFKLFTWRTFGDCYCKSEPVPDPILGRDCISGFISCQQPTTIIIKPFLELSTTTTTNTTTTSTSNESK